MNVKQDKRGFLFRGTN